MSRHRERLHYATLYIFLLGGVSGSLLNLSAAAFLHIVLRWHAFASFFVATLLNELYHHLYYHVIFANREIGMKTPLPIQFSLYLLAALGAVAILSFFHSYMSFSFIPAVLLSIVVLSLINVLAVRIAHFSSFDLAQVEYRSLPESYYQDQTDGDRVSRFRAWYHSSRFQRLNRLVHAYYRSGMQIADLGCGNCIWNEEGLPVTGVDVNERMLQWAALHGRLHDYRVRENLAETDLPAKGFDMVVMAETLEHLSNIPEVLSEVRRILKDEGLFILTVPYDIFLGPFFILFNLNCVYLGYLRGSRYHRYRCGHINHFTRARLRGTLEENGFILENMKVINGLLLYGVAVKDGARAWKGGAVET